MENKKKRGGNFLSKAVSLKKRRGLSPVVTTVLLVVLTISITAIIFFWFRGMVEEGVTKFNPPKNIRLVCEDVDFDADYDSGILSIVNNGEVPIFRVDIKIASEGNFQTKGITEFNAGGTWPTTGLTQGGTFLGDLGSEIGTVREITILPVLIGTSKSGKKTFVCGGQYGRELSA